jgi:hypothetical protein
MQYRRKPLSAPDSLRLVLRAQQRIGAQVAADHQLPSPTALRDMHADAVPARGFGRVERFVGGFEKSAGAAVASSPARQL